VIKDNVGIIGVQFLSRTVGLFWDKSRLLIKGLKTYRWMKILDLIGRISTLDVVIA
jgi:hypothetical protein